MNFPPLFPDERVTVKIVFDWSQLFTKNEIWRVLLWDIDLELLGESARYVNR